MSVDPGPQLFGLEPLDLLTNIARVSTPAIEQSCILFLILAQNKIDQNLHCLVNVFVSRIVDWRIPTLIVDGQQVVLVFRIFQMLLQLWKIHALDVLEHKFFIALLFDRGVEGLELNTRILVCLEVAAGALREALLAASRFIALGILVFARLGGATPSVESSGWVGLFGLHLEPGSR